MPNKINSKLHIYCIYMFKQRAEKVYILVIDLNKQHTQK